VQCQCLKSRLSGNWLFAESEIPDSPFFESYPAGLELGGRLQPKNVQKVYHVSIGWFGG
jgi:hypothetical protein